MPDQNQSHLALVFHTTNLKQSYLTLKEPENETVATLNQKIYFYLLYVGKL